MCKVSQGEAKGDGKKYINIMGNTAHFRIIIKARSSLTPIISRDRIIRRPYLRQPLPPTSYTYPHYYAPSPRPPLPLPHHTTLRYLARPSVVHRLWRNEPQRSRWWSTTSGWVRASLPPPPPSCPQYRTWWGQGRIAAGTYRTPRQVQQGCIAPRWRSSDSVKGSIDRAKACSRGP